MALPSVAVLIHFVDGSRQNNDTKVTADYSIYVLFENFCASVSGQSLRAPSQAQ